jgi:hypothetical protein
MKFLAALTALVFIAGCGWSRASQPSPSPSPSIPTDGVHIDGAIQKIYAIGDALDCSLGRINSTKVLTLYGKSQSGVVMGMELLGYSSPATFSKLDWPPHDSSSGLWLGLLPQGRTWRAYSGQIIVKSDSGGRISGILVASHMREVGGDTTVNAAGSWTCQVSLGR